MSSFRKIAPVIPTSNMERDVVWYHKYAGFETISGNHMYAVLKRDAIEIHLQWHADTPEDPLNGGSVVRIFVDEIQNIFEEFVERGIISVEKLRRDTPWNTHEFGFFDLNKNAIFIVESKQ